MTVLETYKNLCQKRSLPFNEYQSVLSYDETTLFCPAGMQQYRKWFVDPDFKGTITNVQRCLRLNDFAELGDSTHALSFDMLGFFSFRSWNVDDTIWFFIMFLDKLGITPTYVTIHPDKKEWKKFYCNVCPVREQEDCKWSDGVIGGYCTEFFVKKNGEDVEIGNIVNPLGDCIDVGFGKERLEYILGERPLSKIEQLQKAAMDIINSGVKPSANKQGYVLRKIMREIANEGGKLDHALFHWEITRREKAIHNYERLKSKHTDKTPAWWWDTHGVDLSEIPVDKPVS